MGAESLPLSLPVSADVTTQLYARDLEPHFSGKRSTPYKSGQSQVYKLTASCSIWGLAASLCV